MVNKHIRLDVHILRQVLHIRTGEVQGPLHLEVVVEVGFGLFIIRGFVRKIDLESKADIGQLIDFLERPQPLAEKHAQLGRVGGCLGCGDGQTPSPRRIQHEAWEAI